MIVDVGTTSALKLRAVQAAFSILGKNVEVRPHETSSGVPEQPFGFNEILTGARNRATQAQTQGSDMSIGIENGLLYMELVGKYYDVPMVYVIHTRDSRTSAAFGTGIPIPETLVRKLKHEYGDLGLAVQALSGNSEKDPADFFSSGALKREHILTQAVLAAVCEIQNAGRYQLQM